MIFLFKPKAIDKSDLQETDRKVSHDSRIFMKPGSITHLLGHLQIISKMIEKQFFKAVICLLKFFGIFFKKVVCLVLDTNIC